jgi:two-component sensor histidine kinase
MALRKLFRPSAQLHALPLPFRWGGAVLLAGTACGVRYLLLGPTPVAPYLLFLPAVIVAAALFGRDSGLVATAVSALLAVYFFVDPIYSLALTNADTAISAVLFVLIGGFLSVATEALYTAYREAELARREAEAAQSRAELGERERELLLLELGHRVKNDIQRLMAGTRLQAVGAPPEVAAALYATADRLRVIATVHDRLALQSGHLAVNIHDFLFDLTTGLRATMTDRLPIGLFLSAEEHMLSASRAGALGLIVNELVTNAVKHAFPGECTGTITVHFCRQESDYLLTVSDDGVGMPSDMQEKPVSGAQQSGIGRRLMRALAAQLGGRLETVPRDPTGTNQILRFPIVQPGEAVGGGKQVNWLKEVV